MDDIEIILQHDESAIILESDDSPSNPTIGHPDRQRSPSRGEDEMNFKSTSSTSTPLIHAKSAVAAVATAAGKARSGWNTKLTVDRADVGGEGSTNSNQWDESREIRKDVPLPKNLPESVPTKTTSSSYVGDSSPNQGSRRLVEYFVVVSSVPRFVGNPENRNNSTGRNNSDRVGNETGSEFHDGETPTKTNYKSLPVDSTSSPKRARSKLNQLRASRIDSRRVHLMDGWVGADDSVNLESPAVHFCDDADVIASIHADSKHSISSNKPSLREDNGEPIQHSESKEKGGSVFRCVSEQKKRLGIHAAGWQNHLETKFKSIKLGRSHSSEEPSSKQPQHLSDDDDSSYSSFSNDENSPSVFPPSTTFKPSPKSPHRLKIPISTPSPPSVKRREGGATENIRLDDLSFLNSSREYNDDIDDCILEPVITAQYPPVDRPDQPLNPMLTHFCHPQGVENIVPLHEYKMPKVHHFVLTDSKGEKLYGTCLTVYEEFSYRRDGLAKREFAEEDDVSLLSMREEDQERNYVECSMNGSPMVKRHRRRSRNHTYYAPRVLCLLSTWPYLSAFRTYLTQLYRLATTTNLMTAPLERYILNICEEVPAPPPGSFEVQLSILETSIRLWAPPADQPIPYVSVNYGVLFECLDIGNVLFAWYTLACERKILLVSSQLSLLTVCAEILCSMLFPMRFSHLYIPVLPRMLTPMLDAPMPYLCGISRENFPHAVGDISDETVVVDLDRNLITMGSQTPDLPVLPQRRKMKLEAALERHAGEVFWKARGLTKSYVDSVRSSGDENAIAEMIGRADAVWDEQLSVMDEAFNLAHSPDSMSILCDKDYSESDLDRKQSRWDAVQEAFLRFYVAMLKDYRRYLPPASSEQDDWRDSMGVDDTRFMADEFVASQRLDFQPFLEELVSTQQFDDFITRRMYNAGKAPDVTFFDQSIDAKKNRSKLRLKKLETPFLHSANAHRILRRIDAIEPNREDLPTTRTLDASVEVDNVGNYTYPTWPESFDESLFGVPRPIPNIITAEFDRRAALAAMLKDKRIVVEESRHTGCGNPSPEVTSFILFFVTFSQIIGRDWESFKKQNQNMLEGYDFNKTVNEKESSASQGPWRPEVNPPWMAGECFKSLHSNFRPPFEKETAVYDWNDASSYNYNASCCLPDCDNFCSDVGKAIDQSNFIGLPWAPRGMNDDRINCGSAVDEHFENAMTKARSIAKAQIGMFNFTSRLMIRFHSDTFLTPFLPESLWTSTGLKDLGVNTLKMMRKRKLASEPIMYKSLIEACSRCGIAHRASQLLEMMTQDGLKLDSEVYYSFIKAFSHGDTETVISSYNTDTLSEISTSAPSASGLKSGGVSRRASGDGSNRGASYGEETRSIGLKLQDQLPRFFDGLNQAMKSSLEENRHAFKLSKMKRHKRLFKQSLTKEQNVLVTEAVRPHVDLSNCLLDDLYPHLVIDTESDTCPKCSCVLGQDNIILGWTPCDVNDFSTTCPACKHRFVPKFTVSCSSESFEGSQGKGTTLFVDYLSPWVLLRQVRNLILPSSLIMGAKAAKILGVDDRDNIGAFGVEEMIDPKFREGSGINATLWWNTIVTFKRFKIPYTFLLQGSYSDQLIMPTLDDV